MLFHKYAIEPEALNNWRSFRYFADQCGVSHGRLISRYPYEWSKMVYRACTSRPPIEKKRIEEALCKMQKELFPTPAVCRYNDHNSWVNNALDAHKIRPFHAIITQKKNDSPECILADDVSDDCDKWNVPHDIRIARTSVALALAAQELLKLASCVFLVDRYFHPSVQYSKPLCRILDLALQDRPLTKFEYHLEVEDNYDSFRNDIQNIICPYLPRTLNVQLVFIRWAKKKRPRLHPRYILTDCGGLRYDQGLGEDARTGEETDVILMGDKFCGDRMKDYSASSSLYKYVDGIAIKNRRIYNVVIKNGAFDIAS